MRQICTRIHTLQPCCAEVTTTSSQRLRAVTRRGDGRSICGHFPPTTVAHCPQLQHRTCSNSCTVAMRLSLLSRTHANMNVTCAELCTRTLGPKFAQGDAVPEREQRPRPTWWRVASCVQVTLVGFFPRAPWENIICALLANGPCIHPTKKTCCRAKCWLGWTTVVNVKGYVVSWGIACIFCVCDFFVGLSYVHTF